mgnify:CR=1 FL=1
MDTIKFERIQLYGRHGLFAEENRLGQRFYISLELKLDLRRAGTTDRLEETVNYAEVYALVKDIVEKETFRLIETLAETIASRILDAYDKIREVTVRVVKPPPPLDIVFDGVSVELTRRRDDGRSASS